MKSIVLSLIAIISTPMYLQASQYLEQPQLEGVPQSSIPGGPPAYESNPSAPLLILTAANLAIMNRDTKVKTDFANILKKIYSDSTVQASIKKQFPDLTPAQLLTATRTEKEQLMDTQGIALYKSVYGQNAPNVATNVEEQKAIFFLGKQQKTNKCFYGQCACCCYRNVPCFESSCKYIFCCSYKYAGKWNRDEPYCSCLK